MKITELRDSKISPREFELRLHEQVEPRLSVLSTWSPRYLTSKKAFYGIFTKTTFVLQRRKLLGSWLQPIAYGDMAPLDSGIRVHIAWSAHPGSKFFQAICIALAGYLALKQTRPQLVAALLVAAITLPIAIRVQLKDARRALENFLRPAPSPAPSKAPSKDKK